MHQDEFFWLKRYASRVTRLVEGQDPGRQGQMLQSRLTATASVLQTLYALINVNMQGTESVKELLAVLLSDARGIGRPTMEGHWMNSKYSDREQELPIKFVANATTTVNSSMH